MKHLLYRIAGGTLGLLAVCAALAEEPESSAALREKASELFRANQLPEALRSAERAIALDPKDGRNFLYRGLIRGGLHDIDNAIADLSEAIRLDPKMIDAYFFRGLFYNQNRMVNKAILDLTQVLTLDSRHAKASRYRGLLYRDKGESAKAIEDFSTYISLAPNDADAYYERGRLRCQMKIREAAIADCREAIRRGCTNLSDAYYVMGCCMQAMGRNEEALAAYDAAIRKKPDFADAYHNRGNLQKSLRNFERAREDYSRAIELKDACDTRVMRATCLASLSKPAAAIEDLNMAIRIDPKCVPAYMHRAMVFYQQRDFSNVIQDSTSAINLDSKCDMAYLCRGAGRFFEGKPREAIADLTQAIALKCELPVSHYLRGSAEMAVGQFREAIEDYSQSLQLDPTSHEVRLARAMAFKAIGDHDKSFDDLRTAASNISLSELHKACIANDSAHVLSLIKDGKAVDEPGPLGMTPLQLACDWNRDEIAKLLVRHGADVNARDVLGQTALHHACFASTPELVRFLLRAKASPDIRRRCFVYHSDAEFDGDLPLHLACRRGRLDVLAVWSEEGGKLDAKGEDGCRAIDILCRNGTLPEWFTDTDLHDLLAKDTPQGPLVDRFVKYCATGRIERLDFYWRQAGGADVYDGRGITPLCQACQSGHLPVVAFLVAKHADVNLASRDGMTPLHHAARAGHVDVAQILLNAGADFGKTSSAGVTPLEILRNRVDLSDLPANVEFPEAVRRLLQLRIVLLLQLAHKQWDAGMQIVQRWKTEYDGAVSMASAPIVPVYRNNPSPWCFGGIRENDVPLTSWKDCPNSIWYQGYRQLEGYEVDPSLVNKARAMAAKGPPRPPELTHALELLDAALLLGQLIGDKNDEYYIRARKDVATMLRSM